MPDASKASGEEDFCNCMHELDLLVRQCPLLVMSGPLQLT